MELVVLEISRKHDIATLDSEKMFVNEENSCRGEGKDWEKMFVMFVNEENSCRGEGKDWEKMFVNEENSCRGEGKDWEKMFVNEENSCRGEGKDWEKMFVNEENSCRGEGKDWVTHATCIVNSCQGKLLKLYSATYFEIGGDTSEIGVGTIINLGSKHVLPAPVLYIDG